VRGHDPRGSAGAVAAVAGAVVLSDAAPLDILQTRPDKPSYGEIGGSATVEWAMRLFRGTGKIGILEFRKELSLFYVSAALHIELADRGSDLRRDNGLLQRKNHRLGRDILLDRAAFGRCNLHRDYWFRLLFRGAATLQEREGTQCQEGPGQPERM
jgi:hypothetical protein